MQRASSAPGRTTRRGGDGVMWSSTWFPVSVSSAWASARGASGPSRSRAARGRALRFRLRPRRCDLDHVARARSRVLARRRTERRCRARRASHGEVCTRTLRGRRTSRRSSVRVGLRGTRRRSADHSRAVASTRSVGGRAIRGRRDRPPSSNNGLDRSRRRGEARGGASHSKVLGARGSRAALDRWRRRALEDAR